MLIALDNIKTDMTNMGQHQLNIVPKYYCKLNIDLTRLRCSASSLNYDIYR
jgi:hypothetical protein